MRLLCLLFLLSILTACRQMGDGLCDQEKVTTTYEQGKTIDRAITMDGRLVYGIKNGDQTVFTYQRTAAQCDDINDDEYGELLSFAVPLDSSSTRFEYRDEELLDLKCHYFEWGAWVNSGTHYEVRQGVIKGQKVGTAKWDVQCSILTDTLASLDAGKDVVFSQSFSVR